MSVLAGKTFRFLPMRTSFDVTDRLIPMSYLLLHYITTYSMCLLRKAKRGYRGLNATASDKRGLLPNIPVLVAHKLGVYSLEEHFCEENI